MTHRHWWVTGTLAFIQLIAVACETQRFSSATVHDHLHRLVGAGATYCGTLPDDPTPEVLNSLLACTATAYQHRKAFYVLFPQPSMDTTHITGWAARTSGVGYRFTFVSAPPCNRLGCSQEFRSTRCKAPHIDAANDPPRFSCE